MTNHLKSSTTQAEEVQTPPPAVTEADEQEFGDSFVTAVNAIKSIPEDRRATALAMLNNYFAAPAAPSPGEPSDKAGDGRYCRHHDDDPSHGAICYDSTIYEG